MKPVQEELKQLAPEQHARFRTGLKRKLTHPAESRQPVDVMILGGGLAGLTLARQLRRARAALSVLVVEKSSFPVPEAAFKVGESTVEMGAYYLREVLGLADYLERNQLFKAGLRYCYPAGNNGDISRRVELGAAVIFYPTVGALLDHLEAEVTHTLGTDAQEETEASAEAAEIPDEAVAQLLAGLDNLSEAELTALLSDVSEELDT